MYPLRGGLAIFSPDVEDLSSFLVDQRLRLVTVTLPKQFWNRFSHRRGLRQTFFSHPVSSKIYKKETSIKLLRLKKGPSATGKYLMLNMYRAQWGAIGLARWRWRWLRFVSFLASQVFCVLGSSTWLASRLRGGCLLVVLNYFVGNKLLEKKSLRVELK